MEWVETTAKSIEEAKGLALDRLGVSEDDAEFEVLDEPRPGLFGRMRGEARVRARVRPTQARQKVERRERRKSDRTKSDQTPAQGTETTSRSRTPRGPRPASSGSARGQRGAGAAGGRDGGRSGGRTSEGAAPAANAVPSRQDEATQDEATQDENTIKEPQVSAEQVGQEAVRFLDGLVTAFGLSGTTEIVADGDQLEARVHGENLGLLVGPRGSTLQAVQELTRVAAQRRLGDHDTRLRIDVGGYRERRQAALQTFAAQQADAVKDSGVARVLEPMSSADRKVIHDALTTVEGITTRSEGEDPHRRVIIAPSA
jgi:spoIIIJ-associated protein